jgi:hypothetical protein
MKTLSSKEDLANVLLRIAGLCSSDRGLWGRMNAHQMVCHLSDSFRLPLGERTASPVRRPPGPLFVIKWVALRAPFPWPKGTPTAPEMNQELGGTRPRDFAADREVLVSAIERFERVSSGWPPHPFLGPLTTEEWMRWGYLHADHHLRQFGR